MKINTDTKTIEINEEINLGDFFDELITFFGNNSWRDYTLVLPMKLMLKNDQKFELPFKSGEEFKVIPFLPPNTKEIDRLKITCEVKSDNEKD